MQTPYDYRHCRRRMTFCNKVFGGALSWRAALLTAQLMMLAQPVMAGPISVGIHFSDGSAASHIGGLTVDGCSNWVDSLTLTNNGYIGEGYNGLACGSNTMASGLITVLWNSQDSWEGGLSSTTAQDLYFSYLDDGNGGGCNLVSGGSIGVSVTLSGISKWLAANQATLYQMRLYCSSSDNLNLMTTTTPVSVRLGAPNPANGNTQLTALPVLQTVQLQWLGDGGYPTSSNSGDAARGYGDSLPNLSNDTITITVPQRYALPTYTRGSLSAIKLTPANPITAPTGPLLPYEQLVTNDFPYAFWRLNETNGTIAYDYFASYNGSIGSNVTLGVSGPLDPPFVGFGTNNTAMQLNGTTNSCLTMPTLNLNTNIVTITGWMNPSGIQPASAGVVFCRGGTTAAGVNFSAAGNNQLQYTWGARTGVSTGLIVPTNQWSFFALAVTPTNATLYLGTNDVLNSFTDTASETNEAFNAPLLIGWDAGAGTRLFNGRIADVALYEGALSPAQIQGQYVTAAGCFGNPSITGSPTNQTVYTGTNAVFSVSATGPTALSYQWQVSTNSGVSFSNIAGATNASYTTPLLVLSNSGNQYRAVASGVCGTPATSAAATLTVIPPPLDVYGAEVTNLMPQAFWRLNETNGASIAYDYFGVYNGSIGSGVIAGAPGPENPPLSGFNAVNTAMLLNGTFTSCLTMPTFNLNTNTVTITGWMYPNTTELSYAGVVFCRGGTTAAGVNFSGAVNNQLQYTWGGRYGITTPLYVPTNQWSFFALVVTPGGATLYLGTNNVLNSFTDPYQESSQAFDAPLLIGLDAGSGTRAFSGELADIAIFSYSLSPVQIQSLYVNGAGCPGNPTITTNPVNQSVVQGSTATFVSAATGPTALSYQWQVSTNGGANFLNLAGATNTSYTTPVTTLANSGSVYRVVVSGLCGVPATSASATLSVGLPPGYVSATTNDQPLAYWRLTETNGTTAYDFFGVNNGTIEPGVVLGITGPQNPPFIGFETNHPAMLLTGSSSSYLQMPVFNITSNVLSITGWINPSTAQPDWAGVVFWRNAGVPLGVNFGPASISGRTNELQYSWGSRFGISTGLIVPTNQWSFFAMVVTPSGATVYLGTNGYFTSFSDTTPEAVEALGVPLMIGYDTGGSTRLFKGGVSDVALYNSALTLAQIQQLYLDAAGCAGNPTITTNPANQSVVQGSTATFVSAASGPTALLYQWQISTNGGSSFLNLTGATNCSYTTPVTTLANSGSVYRVTVSGYCGVPATSTSATLSVALPPAFVSATTNDLPLAYWRLTETNGTTAYDFFGVNNGTIEPGVVLGINGPRNPPFTGFETNHTAMLLTGSSSSYLQMPVFNTTNNVLTVTGWINPGTAQPDWAGVVFCRNPSAPVGVNFGQASTSGRTNELQYSWGNRYGIGTGLLVPTNQWSFFALVVTPGGATLYLGTNGVLNSVTDTTSEPAEALAAPLMIGYDTGGSTRLFNGGISEVALYNSALSVAQIQQLYIAAAGCLGNPTITTNPVNQSVIQGSTATFVSAATCPTVFGYQWQVSTNSGANFLNLTGATNGNYTTPVTTIANSGSVYRVVATGLCGTPATSASATLTVGLPAAYPIAVTNDGAIAYWRLTETNGTTAYDYFGVNNGTIEPGVVLGINGPQNPPFTGFEANHPAMLLTGSSSSYLQMPVFNTTNNVLTVTGWINPSTAQPDWAGVAFWRNPSAPVGVNFGPASASGRTNELQYSWGNRYGVGTGLIVPTNQWSFFALVVTPGGATLYLGTNGVLNSVTDNTSEPAEALAVPLMIGYDTGSNTRLFNGGISEVALYTNALTAVQLQQMYVVGAGCPGIPSISSQPTNQTVLTGSAVSLSVVATSPTFANYQWQVSTNGGTSFANLTGATNTTYTTPVLTTTNSGIEYQVVIAGLCGAAVTSSVATISVMPLPPLAAYVQAVTNANALAYWRLTETNGTTAYDFFGANNGTIEPGVVLGITGPQNPPFTGFESNHPAMLLTGTGTSYLQMPVFNMTTNVLSVTGWINPSTIQSDWAGVVFWRNAGAPVGINFGQASSGRTNELQYTWGSRFGVSTGLLVPTNQWSFFALVVTPSGATVYLGTNGIFNSSTDTTPEPVEALTAPMLIGYDSNFGARMLKGGVSEVALYTNALTALQLEQMYIAGAGCPGNPSISQQPASQTVIAGSTASFSVSASGPTTVAYQWQTSTNGGTSFANISGATNSTYTTPALAVANSGTQYQVVLSGLCGSPVVSAVATVTVNSVTSNLSTYAVTVTNSSPVAYWRLNEPAGSTLAHDFFGANNGTIEAGVVAGVAAQQNPPFAGFETNKTAMQLNGSGNSYIQMPTFNINSNVMSITGWIDPSTAQSDWAGVVFCRASSPVGVNFGQGSTSGLTNELQYTWGNRFGVGTGLLVPTNQWSFFAVVVTPSGATVYLGANGALNSSTDTYGEPAEALTAPLLIGYDANSGARMYKGLIDEVALYNYALTPSQIEQLYITSVGCPGGPAITNQPVSQAVQVGSTATFSVGATGGIVLSYQWQSSTNGGATYAAISGATNPSYTTPSATLTNNGTLFEAVVSGLCGSPVTSSAATLTVNQPAPPLPAFAQSVTNDGAIAYWRMNETNGATIAYDYFGNYNGLIGSNVAAGVPGPQSPLYPGFETNNTAMLFNGLTNSVLTMPALYLSNNVVSITGWINPGGAQSNSAGIVFCRGGTTVAGLNFGPGSTSGLTNELRYTWNNARNNVSTGLLVPTNQWSFFALVVCPTRATLYLGTNQTLSSYVDSTALATQAFAAPLYIGSDGTTADSFQGILDEIAVYKSSLTPAEIEQMYFAGAGCPGNPTVTAQPTNITVLAGLTATFSVTATGPTPLSYQWQVSTNGGTSFGNITGATNSTYTTPATVAANSGSQYQAVISGLCGTPATSAAAILGISVPPPPLTNIYGLSVTSLNPYAYWRLDETNGASIAYDYYGIYNGAIGSGVIAGVPGQPNPPFTGFETNKTAMELNGSGGSYLTMPTLNLNTNTVTITGWINPSGAQADWSGVVFCRSGTTVAGLNFGQASYIANELRFTWNNNDFGISTGLIVPSNEWSFVALSVTATGATVYVGNGSVLSSYTAYTSLPSQPFDNSLMIGIDPSSGARMFQGLIDEVTIFKNALTPSQIESLYTSAETNGYAPPTGFPAWQNEYFPSGGSLSAGGVDCYGTGMSNTNKFLAGFAGNVPAAYLHIISIAKANGTNIVVTYLGASGDDTYSPGIASRTNVLEFTAGAANGSFTNGAWTQVPGQTNILSGGNGLGTVTNMTDIGGAAYSNRYYRIRILLP